MLQGLGMTQNKYLINPLAPEVSDQCTLQRAGDLNGCPLFCMFLAHEFRRHLVFSAS